MDDELLFLLSGLSPKKGAQQRTLEDCCYTLALELRTNQAWRQVLWKDLKQRKMVFEGVLHIMDQDMSTPKGLNGALAVVRVLCNSGGDPFPNASEFGILRKLVMTLANSLSNDRSVKEDPLFNEPPKSHPDSLLYADLCLTLLVELSSPVFRECSQVVRNEVERGEARTKITSFVRRTLGDSKSASKKKTESLQLVEHLCFTSSTNATAFSEALSTGIIRVLNVSDLRLAALKALVNSTNGVVDAAKHFVTQGAIESVVDCVLNVLDIGKTSASTEETEITVLSHENFDGALIGLSALANLVEFKESTATERIAKDEVILNSIARVYIGSLPSGARAALVAEDASKVVETEWTPENLLLAAHTCLVLGCVVRDSKAAADLLRNTLPGGAKRGFAPLVQVLKTFLEFQADAGILTEDMKKSVHQVAAHLEQANERSMLPPSSLLSMDQLAKKRRQATNNAAPTQTGSTSTASSGKRSGSKSPSKSG